ETLPIWPLKVLGDHSGRKSGHRCRVFQAAWQGLGRGTAMYWRVVIGITAKNCPVAQVIFI
ncbi:hypothetical protein, partial [Pseudomonas amygdali]|uniref:hypothetical protein n=1 Tax=Pseudomonas amygdali TaxID=47877 RepID=UPI001F46B166